MSSSLAFKTGLACIGGAGVIGGGVVLGKNVFSTSKDMENKPKELISKVLEKSLMGLSDNELSAKGEARKTKLGKAKDGDLVSSLKAVKDKSGHTSEDIKTWCKENVGGFVDDEGGKKFKNVSDYCTFSIKDKLTNTISDDNGSTVNNKLKQAGDGLSAGMLAIKTELNKSNGADNDALKKWCNKAYEEMFVGENDQSFKDASTYCVSS